MSWYDLQSLSIWIESWNILNNIENTWKNNFIENIIQDPSSFFDFNFWVLSSIFFFIFFWILSIIWTVKDISSRTNSFFVQICSIFCVFVLSPFVWLPIYIAFRPPQYKNSWTFWQESLDLNVVVCDKCSSPNHIHSKYCIYCGNSIHDKCNWCGNVFSYEFLHCPSCGEKNQKTTYSKKTLKSLPKLDEKNK